MALSRFTRCLRLFNRLPQVKVVLLESRKPILHPHTLTEMGGHPGSRLIFHKSSGSTLEALRIWKVLEFFGFTHCQIVIFRRRIKRFSYPWLSYSIPAALILAAGDIIGQYHLKPHSSERTVGQFFTDEWEKKQTLLFMLMGFFLVGPILSKWNLFLYRKMRCQSSFGFLVRKLLLDLLIISPVLLTLMAAVYGGYFRREIFEDTNEEKIRKMKEIYFPAIRDAIMFNVYTRPVASLGIVFLAPVHLRKLFRTVYEVIFAAYVTDTLRNHLHHQKADKILNRHQEKVPIITTESKSRWTRYKKWACRNKE